MLPLIESPELFCDISNNEKRKIGILYAKKFRLNYREVYKLVRSLDGVTDRQNFIDSLSFGIKAAFDVECMERGLNSFPLSLPPFRH
jgi:hypothetical protein